jgi:hypothetical protein
MKLENSVLTLGLGCLLVVGTACSGNKTAQQSPVASSGAGSGTAPAADAAKKADNALVRFVNATPSSKDLAFGETTPFSNVKADDATAYQSLPAERHDFKLFVNGETNKVMATNSEGLTAGKHYTVVAVTEKDGTFKLDPVTDDLTPPASGKVKVRVINLAPGVENVDLYSSAQKDAVISGAGLDSPTDYKEIAPSDGTLNIRNSTSKRMGEPVKDLNLQAGKLYTILVFSDKHGKLKVKTIEDVFTNAPNGSNS